MHDAQAERNTGFYCHTKQVVTASGEVLPSNAYYVNGLAQTVKVCLGNGAVVEGTERHKVQVVDEVSKVIVWKELSDLHLGDYVVSRVGLNIWPEPKQYVIDNIVVRQDYWASVFALNLLPDYHYIDCSSGTFHERVYSWLCEWGALDFHTLPAILDTKWGSLYRGIPRFVLQGTRFVVVQYLSFLWYLTHTLSPKGDRAEFVLAAPHRTATAVQTLLNNLGTVAHIAPCSAVEGRYNLVVHGKDSIMFMLSTLVRPLQVFETKVYTDLRGSAVPDFEVDDVERAPLVGQVPAMDFREQFKEHLLPDLQSKEFQKRMEAVCEHHDLAWTASP